MNRGVSGGGGGGGVSKIAGLYDLEETLGSGHFAVVKLARHVFTGEKVAVKVIDKTKLDQVSRAHLFQEVRCMKLVQHPNVVRLYEVIDTQTKLYLILELGDGGDLYDYIMRHDSGLSEDVAREYFKQIVRAISYCHRLHVVHRDLKPENVVFFQKLGIVKLTDFGFSNKFCPGQKLETSCGSLAYSAPEILLGDSYDAPAVDVWSLGVILYMLVCGHAPFHEANDSETLTMIMDCKYTIPQHVTSECKALIGRMLVRQADRRATLSQISCDPWMAKGSKGDGKGEGGDSGLPLVCGSKLSEEDHALVLQKMVSGDIASKDEILEAIDNDEYNHITATYYLLAERMLRAHREERDGPKRPQVLGVAPAPMGTPTPPRACLQPSVPATRNLLVPPPATNTLLSVPRTPTDAPQRGRKCSIVREGEEDEDDDGAGGAGRRGSRSEGRLHLLALHNATTPSSHASHNTTHLSSAILKVNLDDENTRMRLGNAGMGTTTGWMACMGVGKKSGALGDGGRPRSAIEGGVSINNNNYSTGRTVKASVKGDCKTQGNLPLLCEDDNLTNTITQAATITIPIRVKVQAVDGESASGAFRTLPSPIRPLKHSLDDSALGRMGDSKGIGEETIIYQQQQQQQQRRNKYHKSHRTTSCSSSDASDEDSEGRKKRNHKHINTPTHKEMATQRRDSHDDSSDSQEQGTVARGNNSAGTNQTSTTSGSGGQQGQGNGGGGTGNGGSGGGSGGTNLSRRHRGGRRAGETRLRESQSLNRITEVQEAADSVLPPQQIPPLRQRGFLNPARIFNKRAVPPLPPTHLNDKPVMEETKIPHTQFLSSPPKTKQRSEEKENCHKINKSNIVVGEKHSFKKMRLLGRYLQVHKKLCLPRWPGLPGLLGGGGRGGRLYKAQSCGSIVRDKITSAGASSLLLVNELCKEKPIVLETHRAHIKLLADMRNSHPHPDTVCRVHLGDTSKCCGMS